MEETDDEEDALEREEAMKRTTWTTPRVNKISKNRIRDRRGRTRVREADDDEEEEEEGGGGRGFAEAGGAEAAAELSEQTTSLVITRENDKSEATSGWTKDDEETNVDPVYRLLRNAQREDEAQVRKRFDLPSGFGFVNVSEKDVSKDERVRALNKEFQREDDRIGDISVDVRECFAIVVEDIETKEAVAYALAHDAKVSSWERKKKLTLCPPRISHVFVKRNYRKRGFGTAIVSHWIRKYAVNAKCFAVDSPNAQMLKLLEDVRCERAVERSGFEAVHFLNLPI